MLHAIPFLPFGDILNTKISRQIDHLNTCFKQGFSLLHRNTIGCGEENKITLIEFCIDRIAEFEINMSPQVSKQLGDTHARFTARCNRLDPYFGVLRQ